MKGLEVLSPGIRSTIQDLGRPHMRAQGVPLGGAFDGFSYRWANHLLSNPPNSATIEIDIGLAKFKALADITIGVAGGSFSIKVNGEVATSGWQTVTLTKDDIIEFSAARCGARCYVAIEGGFDVGSMLDSASTVTQFGLGGLSFDGKVLDKKDRLFALQSHQPNQVQVCDREDKPSCVSPRVSAPYSPSKNKVVELLFVPCYQYKDFSIEAIRALTNQVFTVTPQSNRMGVKLSGEAVETPYPGVISEGVVPGAIQIMPDGSPTLLGVDAQTIGGYPKVGVLPELERHKLGQLPPGQKVKLRLSQWSEHEKPLQFWTRFFGY